MKLLAARRNGTEFRYVVHLDESKVVPGEVGSDAPDPAFVLDCTYTADARRTNETGPQFTARLTAFEVSARAEMKLLCQDRLARLQAMQAEVNDTGVALTGEGGTL